MRTIRYLSTLELEGLPYAMTFIIGKKEKKINHIVIPQRTLTIGLQSSTLNYIEEICEMAQGSDTYIFIDGYNGKMGEILYLEKDYSKLGRITRLNKIAKIMALIL